MPCLLGCFALSVPRFVLFLVWLLGNGYLARAIHSNLTLLLGFFFLPLTTLAYAFAVNTNGKVEGLYLALVIAAVLVDLGIVNFGRGGRFRGRRGPPSGGSRDITVTGHRVR